MASSHHHPRAPHGLVSAINAKLGPAHGTRRSIARASAISNPKHIIIHCSFPSRAAVRLLLPPFPSSYVHTRPGIHTKDELKPRPYACNKVNPTRATYATVRTLPADSRIPISLPHVATCMPTCAHAVRAGVRPASAPQCKATTRRDREAPPRGLSNPRAGPSPFGCLQLVSYYLLLSRCAAGVAGAELVRGTY